MKHCCNLHVMVVGFLLCLTLQSILYVKRGLPQDVAEQQPSLACTIGIVEVFPITIMVGHCVEVEGSATTTTTTTN